MSFDNPSFITGIFKLLGDKTRLRILVLLQQNELAVGELQAVLGISQSTLSSQLGLMRDQSLVNTRKEGQKVYYRIPREILTNKAFSVINETLSEIRQAEWMAPDFNRLEQILRARSESSRYFFNSLKSGEVAPPGQTWESLAQAFIMALPGSRIVDLGCGTGRLAFMMHNAGKHVIGIDSSEERIKAATTRITGIRPASGRNAREIRFLQVDMENTGLPAGETDLVVISQSLHHVAKPPRVIEEAARILRSPGMLLLLDLSSHHDDRMRNKFGDFWLGFDPADLRLWCEQSHLKNISIIHSRDEQTPPEMKTLILTAEK